jgi:hypothetical protein
VGHRRAGSRPAGHGPARRPDPGLHPDLQHLRGRPLRPAYYRGWYDDIVTALPAIDNGQIAPPPGPGLGTSLRPDVLSRPDARIRTTTMADLG